jgi:hypothetical protein
MSGRGFIAPEPARACELCGTVAETRPYGPKGERICFPCGQKNQKATEAGFQRYVLGEEPEPKKERRRHG